MAPAPSAGSTAKIVKLDASTNLTKSEKPKKAGKSGSSDSKQKKRKAGQEASSDDESEDDIVGQLPIVTLSPAADRSLKHRTSSMWILISSVS